MNNREFTTTLTGLQSTLRLFTYKFTRDLDESHDLVQDTLLKALLYKDKFQQNTNLKGWLFTIMRNTFINKYRRNQKVKITYDITENLYFLNREDKHTFHSPDSKFEYDEILKSIHSIREELSKPFDLYVQGYKYHEISERLDIPLGTVKNRIFQARKEIQKKLND